jgi:hypothetical protein
MKPKYEIGVEVEIIKNGKKIKIIDYEIIDNIILYYTDDNLAYPENEIQLNGINWLRKFLSYTDDERDEMTLKSMGDEIKFD